MAPFLKHLLVAAATLIFSGVAHAQSVGDRVDVGGGVRLEALPAQNLKPGRCGLFLWSKSDRPVFVLFATESPAQALVRIGGRNQTLARKRSSGESILGHFEKQTFAGGNYSFQVDLTYDRSKMMQDGAVIEQGVLKTRDKSGFETVVPVGGMIGCSKS